VPNARTGVALFARGTTLLAEAEAEAETVDRGEGERFDDRRNDEFRWARAITDDRRQRLGSAHAGRFSFA
jgi:hypothetical protein